jgi:hypothetical protein
VARPEKKRQRRSLAHVGGAVEVWGKDPHLTSLLVRALDVRAEEGTREHVHGFHSYPARMHPRMAQRLVEALSKPRGLVLDPFCGSGTVLVEARRAGRRAVGIDANPLAIELTWLKTRGATHREAVALIDAARRVRAGADERRLRRAGATRSYGPEDVALFDPHVLLELDGLRRGLLELEAGFVRRALFLVLSAILVKVSRRPGDTGEGRGPRRLAAGFTTALFFDKSRELGERLEDFRGQWFHDAPSVEVDVGDARALPHALTDVDLVVTSPPYPGTYDYLSHHALRLRWLGLDTATFAQTELGARRHFEHLSGPAGLARWRADFGAALGAMARALHRDGTIVLVVADSVIGRQALYADEEVRQLAPAAHLEMYAMGSQRRPHFHGPSARSFDRRPRREHAMMLRRGR